MRAISLRTSTSSMRADPQSFPAWSMPTAMSPFPAARIGSTAVLILRTNCSTSRSTTGTSWAARACAGPATSGLLSPWIRGTDRGAPSRSAFGNDGGRTRIDRGSGSREPGSATAASSREASRSRQTTTLPRFVSDEGKERIARRRERAIESVRLAYRAGVSIATGTDFGGGSLRANHLAWEVEALVEAGLKPWEALASATVRGGELLGEGKAGRIVEGGPADFFLVHGDPLTDPTALWRVWRVAWLDG